MKTRRTKQIVGAIALALGTIGLIASVSAIFGGGPHGPVYLIANLLCLIVGAVLIGISRRPADY